jgi:hypothetical protein
MIMIGALLFSFLAAFGLSFLIFGRKQHASTRTRGSSTPSPSGSHRFSQRIHGKYGYIFHHSSVPTCFFEVTIDSWNYFNSWYPRRPQDEAVGSHEDDGQNPVHGLLDPWYDN